MNGIRFLRKLRKEPKLQNIPAVVLTISNADKDKVEADSLNVYKYILKPVTSNFAEVMAPLNNYWTLSEML